ncbi:MAG TPA: class I SAM-dependent methyltransferase [Chthonomonadaceae bacterium]|nr:class I SAM-dependent methyltransferase [Chthonomonadaceae bacterium]
MEKTEAKPLARGWSGQPIWDLALKLVAEMPGGRLLDAPSGGGYLSVQLAERGFQVVGVDMIAELWQFPEMPFVCADLDSPLPFAPDSFDVILHVGGLGYMENPSALFRDFYRLLRPGGVLGVTADNIFTLESRLRFLLNGTFRWYPHCEYHGEDKAGLHLINRDPIRLTTLLFLLQRAGFQIEKVEFGGKRGFAPLLPLGWLLRGLTTLHNGLRQGKGSLTPPLVNSRDALLFRQVGVLARK